MAAGIIHVCRIGNVLQSFGVFRQVFDVYDRSDVEATVANEDAYAYLFRLLSRSYV
jgi:hypothetical protein